MRKLFLALFLICTLNFSGCFWLVIGGVGAVGGYAVSRDTIQGDKEVGLNKMWDSAYRIAGILGTITKSDKEKYRIDLDSEGSKVHILIEQLTPKTVRLKVTSRKYLMPNIKLAQKVYIKIINEVDRNPFF